MRREQLFFPAPDFLVELEGAASQLADSRQDGQFIIELGRTQVLDLRAAYDEHDAMVGAQLGLLEALASQPFGAGALAEFKIFRVIHHAAGIGIFVIDPHRPAESRELTHSRVHR